MSKEPEKKELSRLPPISKSLHSEFKGLCGFRGMSMQEAAGVAIKEWIEKNKTKPK
jgi:hypothetical protein